MSYTVYILYSAAHAKYYIGQTENLLRRLKQHNGSDANGWTKRYQPWKLVFAESFPTRAGAMRIERYLKSLKNIERVRQYIDGWRSGRLQG